MTFSSGLHDINAAVGSSYVLFFDDEPSGYSQSIIFAKIDRIRNGSPMARDFSTMINTEDDIAHVTGSLVGCGNSPCSARFSVNGEVREQQASPWFALEIATLPGIASEIDVHSSRETDLTTVLVSFSRQRRLSENVPGKLSKKVFEDGF